MDILLVLHSWLRWAIVAVALAAIVRFTLGWRRGGPYDRIAQGLQSGFGGLMDLQGTLGLVMLFWSGFGGDGFPAYRVEHSVTMIIAIAASHLPAMWKKNPDKIRCRNALFAVVGALALVFLGVARLPGGWSR